MRLEQSDTLLPASRRRRAEMREGASTAGIVMRDKAARACWVTFYFGQFIEKIGNRGDFIGFLGNAGLTCAAGADWRRGTQRAIDCDAVIART